VDSSAQCDRPHIGKTGLFLPVNSDVIAVDIVRRMLLDGGIEFESDTAFKFFEKTLSRPSMPQK
jgi:hypothetical protein